MDVCPTLFLGVEWDGPPNLQNPNWDISKTHVSDASMDILPATLMHLLLSLVHLLPQLKLKKPPQKLLCNPHSLCLTVKNTLGIR